MKGEDKSNTFELDTNDISEILFDTAAEGLVVVDGTGIIRKINPRIVQMFGYSSKELLGQKIEILIPKKAREKHVSQRDGYVKHPEQRSMGIGMDLKGERKDGSTFDVEIALNHFEVNGQRMVMGLVSDVTQRKEAEKELLELNERLENRVAERTQELENNMSKLIKAEHDIIEALNKERELGELKSRFVSMASHEFRTPLASILSSTSLLKKYVGEPDKADRQVKHLERIRISVRHLTNILNDFLSLDKLEEGKVEVRNSQFNLAEFCDEISVDTQDGIGKTGQEIRYKHDGIEEIIADQQMLKHIFQNLLSNALKYSPEESKVLFNTIVKDKLLIATVKDSGIGIPKDEQANLFTRFFRAKNAFNIEGTGLGLNIIKKYIEMTGGNISFTSEENNGTTFTVSIPLSPITTETNQ